MASDGVVINLEDLDRRVAREASPRGDSAPSEDTMAQAFAERYGAECGYVWPWHHRVTRTRKRWTQDSTGNVFALIRKLVLLAVSVTKDERRTASAACCYRA